MSTYPRFVTLGDQLINADRILWAAKASPDRVVLYLASGAESSRLEVNLPDAEARDTAYAKLLRDLNAT